MRMGYPPLLALLEPSRATGFRRLAVIGIPCQVDALRVLEGELGFERLYVVGTPELPGLLGDEIPTEAPGSAGKRRGPVTGFLKNVQRAAGGLPLRRLPGWCTGAARAASSSRAPGSR
jgi:hypothetical protein